MDQQHPGEPVAYAANFASFLYMFVGPNFDRPVYYVSTHEGPALSYLKHGVLRDQFDQDAWEKNLKASGAKLLISFRFFDRQLESSKEWPQEYKWAKKLHFPVLHENKFCCVHEVVFPEVISPSQKGYSANNK
jgi:hypothetical protein